MYDHNLFLFWGVKRTLHKNQDLIHLVGGVINTTGKKIQKTSHSIDLIGDIMQMLHRISDNQAHDVIVRISMATLDFLKLLLMKDFISSLKNSPNRTLAVPFVVNCKTSHCKMCKNGGKRHE